MAWLTRILNKRRAEKQLDSELRFHFEQQVADYIAAGMVPEEARRRARLEFGGLDQVKEQVRDGRWEVWLESIYRDFHFAFRSLAKDKRFALVAILTLALGIGATTTVLSVFYNLLFNAFAAKDASRLAVPVVESAESAKRSGVSYDPLECFPSNIDAIREAFEDVACYGHTHVLLNDGREIRQFESAYVTANAFDFYGVSPLLGRGIKPEDGKPGSVPVFVISYGTWTGEFSSDPSVLGKSFTINDVSRVLVGIMPPHFQAYGALVRLWMPINVHDASIPHGNLYTLGRLRPGETIDEASAKLDVIVRRLSNANPDAFPKHFTARVQSASDFLMGPWGIGSAGASKFGLKGMIYALLASVLMLLFIACSNVANLLLARATVREKEIAIRTALGATGARLVRQLLVESSVLAAMACLVGCTFAYFGLKGVTAIMPIKGSRLAARQCWGSTARFCCSHLASLL